MQLHQLYEASSLQSYSNWKRPNVDTLKADFAEYKSKESKWTDRARIIQTWAPIFADFDSFRSAVKGGEIREIDRGFVTRCQGMSNVSTIGALKSLTSTYSSPRDVDRIVSGFSEGSGLPMPILLRGDKEYWVLSGNTRCNAAFILGFKPKVIIIDLPKKSKKDTDENNA